MLTAFKHRHISVYTAQKMKFPIKDFFIKCDQTQEILNGNLQYLVMWSELDTLYIRALCHICGTMPQFLVLTLYCITS